VGDAGDLAWLKAYMHVNVTPPVTGKWTDLLVPPRQRSLGQ